MSYEAHKSHLHGMTPSERRALTYEKEPVDTLANLWEKYPEGGLPGWYCLVKSLHAFYGWDENSAEWIIIGKQLTENKHDKKNGMLVRFLTPGNYTQKDNVVIGEVVIIPLNAGDFILYNNQYRNKKQTIPVTENEVGQVIILSSNGKLWEKITLPVYDYLREKLESLENNRGIVTQNPNNLNFHPLPQSGNYVYFKDSDDSEPFMWIYTGHHWEKTSISMPSAEITPLTEYARHGYTSGEHIKTLAEVEAMLDALADEYKGLNDNVDGGNASTVFGGCKSINGGNAFTNYEI